MSWAIVTTRSAAEETVAVRLHKAGFRTYLPVFRKKLYPHGRNRRPTVSLRPLFATLVFVDLDRSSPADGIRAVNGVEWVVCAADGTLAKISNAEMEELRERELNGEYDEDRRAPKREFSVQRGDTVRVQDGPFASLLGRLDQLDEDGRCRVLLGMFGRETEVRMDVDVLEKVG